MNQELQNDFDDETDIYDAVSSLKAEISGPPIYDKESIITRQPTLSDTNNRCPLPIAGLSSNSEQIYFIPFSGVQLLNDFDQINIEQTVELDDLSSVIESENRFIIKGENGQIIYSGLENSSSRQRLFCGSGRRFNFTIFDRSKQEALYFIRRLACANPIFGCYLQRVDVFLPHNEYIGCIQQLWAPLTPTFAIRNSNNREIFRVKGLPSCLCSKYAEAEFNVCKNDNILPVMTISHQWDERLVNYNTRINFPPRTNYIYKSLMIACAILLEYMYFEVSKSGSSCFQC